MRFTFVPEPDPMCPGWLPVTMQPISQRQTIYLNNKNGLNGRLARRGNRRSRSAPDISMKDIAARCGFGNEATFLRRFGKSFGTSPGQHRAHFGSQMRD
ncbi:AraC family transcriptional regulator [Mesorhizobium sp. LjRoot246]|uniref:AraC family transcriptional regulator n=1 Tax=Mesorhizobium sp. LjRoot246 TaxID=3342294 RepID=UPI003F501953